MSKTVLFLCCLFLGAVIMTAQPKLEVVGGTSVDFGKVYSGSKTSRSVILKNGGSETLRINKVEGSCGCTATLVSKDQLAPNDTASVSITFNSAGYLGKVTKTVKVTSNDTSQPTVTISFITDVITILQMDPQYLLFYGIKVDSVTTKTVKLKNVSSDPIKIFKVTTKERLLKVRVRKTSLKPGEETELVGTFTPKKAGSFEGEIELQTNNRVQKIIPVRFHAVIIEK